MNRTQAKKWKFASLRKQKRAAFWRRWKRERTDVRVGDVVENYDLHIGRVLKVDRKTGDMQIQSFFSGKVSSCDLYHDGIARQTTKQICQKLQLYQEGGMDALSALYDKSC